MGAEPTRDGLYALAQRRVGKLMIGNRQREVLRKVARGFVKGMREVVVHDSYSIPN
jgi:hypothetical protein